MRGRKADILHHTKRNRTPQSNGGRTARKREVGAGERLGTRISRSLNAGIGTGHVRVQYSQVPWCRRPNLEGEMRVHAISKWYGRGDVREQDLAGGKHRHRPRAQRQYVPSPRIANAGASSSGDVHTAGFPCASKYGHRTNWVLREPSPHTRACILARTRRIYTLNHWCSAANSQDAAADVCYAKDCVDDVEYAPFSNRIDLLS
ncbi:hypothetical protein DFH07DRAFT_842303 [Mycena maculata]|uniref:Uncharacterized protein n=1 Tax=Mycena maculata TaxID=230809 RepID=A0AAD7MY80_9AGAR|nr:hypothetical protein DFH07DRAFT_842303 [Mycena maculata]